MNNTMENKNQSFLKINIEHSLRELKNDLNSFLIFLKNNKLTIILVWFFILLAYGIKLFFYSISIDTELIINDYNGTLHHWLGIGRFGLVFIKRVLDLVPFNPYAACFLMICAMFLFSIFLSFLFSYLTFQEHKNNKINFILPCIFITFSFFAEQFNFILQGFEVAFTIFLVFLTAFLITRWVIDSKNIIHLVLGILCMTLSFASYQANVFLYISVILACYFFIYMVNWQNKLKILKDNFFKTASIKYLLTFICGYILYFILDKLLVRVHEDYTDSMVHWKTNSISFCLKDIHNYILSYKFYLVLSVIILILGIINLFSKNKDKILFLLSSIALATSPFFLPFYLGSGLLPRTQFSLPFVYAFAIYILAWLLRNTKVLVYFILALAIALSFNHAYNVSNLMYNDYMKYQSEVNLANKITDRIDSLNLDNVSDYPVVFVGSIYPSNVKMVYDVIGRSFFNFDAIMSPLGNTGRILGFMNTIGYPYKAPTNEEIEKGKAIAKDMKNWPNTDSVKFKDGIIVVKLS